MSHGLTPFRRFSSADDAAKVYLHLHNKLDYAPSSGFYDSGEVCGCCGAGTPTIIGGGKKKNKRGLWVTQKSERVCSSCQKPWSGTEISGPPNPKQRRTGDTRNLDEVELLGLVRPLFEAAPGPPWTRDRWMLRRRALFLFQQPSCGQYGIVSELLGWGRKSDLARAEIDAVRELIVRRLKRARLWRKTA